jgi:hypothetical protein
MSGKVNEFIGLFVGDVDTPASGADQWRVETEPPPGPRRFRLFHCSLNSGKNELARRAALASSGLMDAAVKITRQIDRGTDRIGLHTRDYLQTT